jgi:uncharacterized protein YjbJ (UPF0337 family)
MTVSAFEEAKGKAKEATGSLTGSDDLREEGQAQQRKSEEERKAEDAQAEAEKHADRAERHENAESRHQGS